MAIFPSGCWRTATAASWILSPASPSRITDPANRFDPVAVKMLALMPPSSAANAYQIRLASPTNRNTEDQLIGRFDQQLTPRSGFGARVPVLQSAPWNYAPEHLYIVKPGQKAHSRNVTANHSWVLSPTWVNDANYTHNVTESNSNPPAELPPRSLEGYGSRVKVLPGLPTIRVTINGWYGPTSARAIRRSRRTTSSPIPRLCQWPAQSPFGSDFRRYSLDKTAPFSSGGNITFNGQLFSEPGSNNAGNSFAEFVLGQASAWRQQSAWSERFTNNYIAFFVQEDWRANSRFTLNLGLRWDPGIDFKENLADKSATFIPGLKSQRFPNAPLGMQFLATPGSKTLSSQPEWNNLAPRIGVAYQVTPKTVIRSAIRIFTISQRASSITAWAPASLRPAGHDERAGAHVRSIQPAGPSWTLVRVPGNALCLHALQHVGVASKYMPNRYMQNWNLIVERQVFGSAGPSRLRRVPWNAPDAGREINPPI